LSEAGQRPARRALSQDNAAVEALARDGFVELAGGEVRLAEG
jgi:hypothetical protein